MRILEIAQTVNYYKIKYLREYDIGIETDKNFEDMRLIFFQEMALCAVELSI